MGSTVAQVRRTRQAHFGADRSASPLRPSPRSSLTRRSPPHCNVEVRFLTQIGPLCKLIKLDESQCIENCQASQTKSLQPIAQSDFEPSPSNLVVRLELERVFRRDETPRRPVENGSRLQVGAPELSPRKLVTSTRIARLKISRRMSKKPRTKLRPSRRLPNAGLGRALKHCSDRASQNPSVFPTRSIAGWSKLPSPTRCGYRDDRLGPGFFSKTLTRHTRSSACKARLAICATPTKNRAHGSRASPRNIGDAAFEKLRPKSHHLCVMGRL